jgi:ADYC domain
VIRRAAEGFTILAALAIAGPPSWAVPQTAAPSVEIVGTAFHVTLADGHVLTEVELMGVVLSVGDGSGKQRRIRIDAVERDPKDPDGEVMLYALSEQDPESGEWRNACMPDPDGRRLGFPLAGQFTPDGRYQPSPGKLLITCTGGAEGKCVRFGYKPWGHTRDGVSLAPYYQACVRMVRADYCGDGVRHTRNGTPVDIFDRIGIQKDEPAEGMTLEAAWAPEGAVCVRHTRLTDVLSREGLAALCPERLEKPCDESTPAFLYDRSFGR